MGHGFIRAWPEHLKSASGCSNPKHFLEMHPLQTLTCGGTGVLDYTQKLGVVDGLGFKSASIVRNMLTMQLWVCEECEGATSDASLKPIEFDFCFGTKGCSRPQASNFARFQARPIVTTIRPKKDASLDGFATVIARVLPVDPSGNASDTREPLLKLYALQGSAFYDRLLALRDSTGTAPTLDIIGIFTIDPFSVLKVIEKPDFPHGQWVDIPFPIALVVFGETM